MFFVLTSVHLETDLAISFLPWAGSSGYRFAATPIPSLYTRRSIFALSARPSATLPSSTWSTVASSNTKKLSARYLCLISASSERTKPRNTLFGSMSLHVSHLSVSNHFVLIQHVVIVQSAGGGMQATSGAREIGDKVFLVGIILQGILFVFYLIMVIIAQRRLIGYKGASDACFPFFAAIYFTAVLFLVSSSFSLRSFTDTEWCFTDPNGLQEYRDGSGIWWRAIQPRK